MRQTKNSARIELVIVIAILGSLAIANAMTATLYPLVWLDEVMYSDPAIHLLQGTGFTSTAWYNVTFDRFWYGNTPLHAILLALWGKVFGLSLESVRLFGHVLAIASAFIFWLALRRLIPGTIVLRLLFVIVFLTAYAMAFAYRSGRPDSICLVVTSLLVYSSTIASERARHFALASAASMASWAGLQLVIAIAFTGTVLWILSRNRRRDVLAAAIGVMIGAVGLALFYAANNSLWEFLNATVVSTHTIVGQTGRLVVLGDQRLLERLLSVLTVFGNPIVQDLSMVILLGTIAILVIIQRRHESFRQGLFALAIGVTFPLFMTLAGKYPLYYAWMGFLLVLLASLPLFEASISERRSAAVAIIGLCMASVVGLPFQLYTALSERSSRDYSLVREYVGNNVRYGEWVYVTSPAYFAATEHGAFVLSGSYTGSRLSPEIPPEQRERIATIISSPTDFPTVRALVGGDWEPVSRSLRTGDVGSKRDPHDLDRVYHLQVYRRNSK